MIARLSCILRRGGLSATVRGSLVGRRRFFDDDGETVAERYATVDARLAYDLARALNLFAGTENLMSEGDPVLLPIPPRTFYVGLIARYR